MRVGVQLARFLVAEESSIGLDSAQGLTLFARMTRIALRDNCRVGPFVARVT